VCSSFLFIDQNFLMDKWFFIRLLGIIYVVITIAIIYSELT